jgi:hypothetical protein
MKWGLSMLDWRSHAINGRAEHPIGVLRAECGRLLVMVTALHEKPYTAHGLSPLLATEGVAEWSAGGVDDYWGDEIDVAGADEDFPAGVVHVAVMSLA